MSTLGDITESLQTVLARLQHLDFWPPLDAARTVVDAVSTVIEVAASSPDPDPENVRDAAAGWGRTGRRWEEAVEDLASTASNTPETIWSGTAGDSYRSSLSALDTRLGSVPPEVTTVEKALWQCADEMSAARARHDSAYPQLFRHLHISWSDLLPWEAVDHVRQIAGDVADVVEDLIGSYQDASRAIDTCAAVMSAALDTVTLPAARVPGLSATESTNRYAPEDRPEGALHGPGLADDTGPLRGTVPERAQAALDAMAPAERAEAEQLLASAADPTRRAWVVAALASGLTGPALASYAKELSSMSESEVAALDPTTTPGTFTQPDATTCGSSTLVMARMLNDPAYAMYITTGVDPRGELPDLPGAGASDRFDAAALDMHDETNTFWPQALGTFPDSVADQMEDADAPSGVPGSSYQTDIIDPTRPDRTYDDIVEAVEKGHAVPLYSYGIQEPGTGAHVTLVIGTSGDDVIVYEPGSGEYRTMSREAFRDPEATKKVLGWSKTMAVVLPG